MFYNDIELIKIHQVLSNKMISNLSDYICKSFEKSDLKKRIKPGDKIGLTVGSRGISSIKIIIKTIINKLKKYEVRPFILVAMGSHGGSTSEGQKRILANYGITEDEMGVPILSSTEVVKIGKIKNEIPIFFSKDALLMDGIIAINRIKPHTDFKSNIIESGISKILVIGLGKIKGARVIHSLGVYGLKNIIPEAVRLILKKLNILQGVGILENYYGQLCDVKFISPESLIDSERKLLSKSKKLILKLPYDEIDVLICQEIGKNISGTGLDTNIIGRLYINGENEIESPNIRKIVVFDLTKESEGNAYGIGLADITTKDLVQKINFKDMYVNSVTSTFLRRGKLPLIAETQKEAVEVALKTCWQINPEAIRLVIIKNTRDLRYLYVSKTIWNYIKSNKNIKKCGKWTNLSFDSFGKMKLKL